MLIRYCAIIFGCLALGELIVYLTGIHFPSSIIGMILLTLFLHLGWIKLHWVKAFSDMLISHLGLFFVPPSVAILAYFDLIAKNFWSISVAIVVSTIIVMVVTGHVYQFIRKRTKHHHDHENI
ncbi:CidA/LrgA family protein [Capnocytophaga gingivalis]|jgi:lrgA family protein|uniref:CidA/LrgA family protein n=2 Tax=Capnocytophaga gingivalis TaxID=1017 RepID=A0ABU5YAF5_9FLAO|nr:CidA/LrgA family protein [Capnocytophaga gingivalis]MBF1126412.1 CidA/LrgA family protein [Capnocytophaga sp.]EEK13372.1 LrgA family protein [Capnocytophaga gingivalis ATCC 33624]MEB3012968.1 CidA/LrgA family protein [Capnocytophaga gingivalis]MEB3040923.1 CidA/LrgA family protein [Capnocytophaga gingivalis]MEB3076172.1 CidA/LrgA family protein [Capnocytophaga gingivalis]